MRIAQVVSSYSPVIGGVQTHVRRLAEGLTECGEHVTVLTHQIGDLAADEWVGPVRVLRFPLVVKSPNYPLSLQLFRYLQSHTAEFDLVHAHSYHTLVGHAAVRSPLPFVFTPHYHGTGHTPFRALLHRVYRYVGARQLKAADALICMSSAERNLLTSHFPWTDGKVVTIPPGTDPKSPVQAGGQAFQREPVVLTVGRLERYKNVDLVIDAFRALPCEATLVVVGDGPDRARLEAHARATEPGWPVIFTGSIPDRALEEWFMRAKVVTSASDHEAFGLTLADGLASGARVVASAIPAHAEVARLAGAGAPVTLLEARDTRSFAEVLEECLLAGRVPATDLELPTWDDVVEETRKVYARVCERVGTPPRASASQAAPPRARPSAADADHPWSPAKNLP